MKPPIQKLSKELGGYSGLLGPIGGVFGTTGAYWGVIGELLPPPSWRLLWEAVAVRDCAHAVLPCGRGPSPPPTPVSVVECTGKVLEILKIQGTWSLEEPGGNSMEFREHWT